MGYSKSYLLQNIDGLVEACRAFQPFRVENKRFKISIQEGMNQMDERFKHYWCRVG